MAMSSRSLAPAWSTAARSSDLTLLQEIGSDQAVNLDAVVLDQRAGSERERQQFRDQRPARQPDFGKHRLKDQEQQALEKGSRSSGRMSTISIWSTISAISVLAGGGHDMLKVAHYMQMRGVNMNGPEEKRESGLGTAGENTLQAR